MAVIVQVAGEYVGLATGNAGSSSFGTALDRVTTAVPPEYVLVGAGVLLLLYLVRR
jgi:hypothetical protein